MTSQFILLYPLHPGLVHVLIFPDYEHEYDCDNCRGNIIGNRYRCLECPDHWDFCENCIKSSKVRKEPCKTYHRMKRHIPKLSTIEAEMFKEMDHDIKYVYYSEECYGNERDLYWREDFNRFRNVPVSFYMFMLVIKYQEWYVLDCAEKSNGKKDLENLGAVLQDSANNGTMLHYLRNHLPHVIEDLEFRLLDLNDDTLSRKDKIRVIKLIKEKKLTKEVKRQKRYLNLIKQFVFKHAMYKFLPSRHIYHTIYGYDFVPGFFPEDPCDWDLEEIVQSSKIKKSDSYFGSGRITKYWEQCPKLVNMIINESETSQIKKCLQNRWEENTDYHRCSFHNGGEEAYSDVESEYSEHPDTSDEDSNSDSDSSTASNDTYGSVDSKVDKKEDMNVISDSSDEEYESAQECENECQHFIYHDKQETQKRAHEESCFMNKRAKLST